MHFFTGNNISVRLSVFLRLSGSGSQHPQKGNPDSPLPGHFHQLLKGDPEAFPGQPRDIIPPACPGSAPRSPPCWTCPKHLPRETSGRRPHQMSQPLQLAPLDAEEQRLYSQLLIQLPCGGNSFLLPKQKKYQSKLWRRGRWELNSIIWNERFSYWT